MAAFSFAFMTVLMSGVNMFAMAEVMKVVLGWDLNFSHHRFVRWPLRLCGARRTALRNFQ